MYVICQQIVESAEEHVEKCHINIKSSFKWV